MRTLILGLLVLFLGATTAFAQGDVEEAVKEIAEGLNCPLCRGLTLYDCPLTVCEQMRGVIREKLEAGESREAIVQYFVDQYGEEVLYAPTRSGFNLAAWVLPIVGILVGGALVGFAVFTWLRPVASPAVEEPPVPAKRRDPYQEQVERELEELQ